MPATGGEASEGQAEPITEEDVPPNNQDVEPEAAAGAANEPQEAEFPPIEPVVEQEVPTSTGDTQSAEKAVGK